MSDSTVTTETQIPDPLIWENFSITCSCGLTGTLEEMSNSGVVVEVYSTDIASDEVVWWSHRGPQHPDGVDSGAYTRKDVAEALADLLGGE